MSHLEDVLADLARRTWDEFGRAFYRLGFTPEERYFTDRALLELERLYPRVYASRSSIDEHTTGADFEWWIRDGSSVAGLLVQAKRLRMEGMGSYEGIDRQTDSGRSQPEQLIATARSRGMTPIYVMYNGGRPSFPPGPCAGDREMRSRGTTVTSARHVHRLALSSSVATLAEVQESAIPWECLLSCPAGKQAGPRAPSRILNTLRTYDMQSETEVTTEFAELSDRVRALFEGLEALARAIESPDGGEDFHAGMRAIADEDAAARVVVVTDASGADG